MFKLFPFDIFMHSESEVKILQFICHHSSVCEIYNISIQLNLLKNNYLKFNSTPPI
jgi:hypothetical protein